MENPIRILLKYKMQSETVDFATGSATWRTERNIRVVFDSGPFAFYVKNMTSSTKTEVHNTLRCPVFRAEPSHGHR